MKSLKSSLFAMYTNQKYNQRSGSCYHTQKPKNTSNFRIQFASRMNSAESAYTSIFSMKFFTIYMLGVNSWRFCYLVRIYQPENVLKSSWKIYVFRLFDFNIDENERFHSISIFRVNQVNYLLFLALISENYLNEFGHKFEPHSLRFIRKNAKTFPKQIAQQTHYFVFWYRCRILHPMPYENIHNKRAKDWALTEEYLLYCFGENTTTFSVLFPVIVNEIITTEMCKTNFARNVFVFMTQ